MPKLLFYNNNSFNLLSDCMSSEIVLLIYSECMSITNSDQFLMCCMDSMKLLH